MADLTLSSQDTLATAAKTETDKVKTSAAVVVSPLQRPRTDDWKEIEKFYQALVQRFSYWEYSVTSIGTVTPRFVGDRCLETTNDVWYFAVGTTSADWVEI